MDTSRIDELKRRIERDPASIAFAQLGEEYRRAGLFRDAVRTCRAGLEQHPGYLSARVTLGRALAATGDLIAAERELREVLRVAPENLAALRALADIASRRGERAAALSFYQRCLSLAPQDAELRQRVETLLTNPRGNEKESAPSTDAQRRRRLLAFFERWHDAIIADAVRRHAE